MKDDYYSNALAPTKRVKTYPQVQIPAVMDEMVVEDIVSGFCGAIVAIEKGQGGNWLRLEDAKGHTRIFPLKPGFFAIDGVAVELLVPQVISTNSRSNSGSVYQPQQKAKVAICSRIWVEGVHDAAIVEKVWGHDLRQEGVVVEQLEGLDNLAQKIAGFELGNGVRLGILVDHLITGSKETRLTANLGPDVMVTGHPYVDIWQGVKPSALKIASWPQVSRDVDWKTGICQQLGWGTAREGWQRVYSAVNSYKDLESPLIGAVEKLIDFVTVSH